jgi:NAD(P)-dependent dehydrogenase (short-subunit alcohol dehydrogenase family)
MDKPVVLITGGLTGIGRATALAFAQKGARVVISGRRDDAGQALVAELRTLGAEAEFVRADVRHEDDVRNLVDKAVERFGRLDVAVNNAGTEGKPASSQPCQRNALEGLKRSLRRLCFWRPTRWTTSPVKSSGSMAARLRRDPAP